MDAVNIPAQFELRSFTLSGDNRGYWENLGRPWILPRSLFSQIFKRLLLGWTPWIYLPNLTFVALRIPEIIWGIYKKLESPWIRPRSLFSQILKWLLFACTLWIYLPNLNFVALRVPEIIGGTAKIWTVIGYAHAPFSRKFLTGFCSDGPCEYTCQIWSL